MFLTDYHIIIHYFATRPGSDWYALVALLLSSDIISGLVDVVKPLLKTVESRYGVQFKHLVVGLMALLPLALSTMNDLLTSNGGVSPGTITGQTAIIGFAAYVIHNLGGSKTFNLLSKVVQVLSDIHTVVSTGKLPVKS
jgi:hypothetical protein